jgi:ElaB/YqjD/DUF883 family membrane-anchored ribosome-binding protein
MKVQVDDVLKKMAEESVKQGENLRVNIRDLTLKALHARELTLEQVRQVVTSITEGINVGAAKAKVDAGNPLADALRGMDDALLKAVEASRITLELFTDHGVGVKDSLMMVALDELERLEDEFLRSVKESADNASREVRAKWTPVLEKMKPGATETGSRVASAIEEFSAHAKEAVRQQRRATLKATTMMTQSFGTLASGVLVGLAEGMKRAPAASKTSARKGKSTRA